MITVKAPNYDFVRKNLDYNVRTLTWMRTNAFIAEDITEELKPFIGPYEELQRAIHRLREVTQEFIYAAPGRRALLKAEKQALLNEIKYKKFRMQARFGTYEIEEEVGRYYIHTYPAKIRAQESEIAAWQRQLNDLYKNPTA